jgi:hypothetical protein
MPDGQSHVVGKAEYQTHVHDADPRQIPGHVERLTQGDVARDQQDTGQHDHGKSTEALADDGRKQTARNPAEHTDADGETYLRLAQAIAPTDTIEETPD